MRIKVKNPTRFTLFILSILAVIFLISACRNHFLTMGDLRDSLSRNHGRENLEKKYMVVIDPGHGGKDSGAIGASGRFEKDFTLSLSKKVAERLEQEPEIGVYLTREDDSFISTKGSLRAAFANERNADLFISIHGNTFNDPDLSGTQSFYYHDNCQAFAEVMHRHVLSATGFIDRGVEKGNFFVLRDTHMPSVLLEIGYLTNPRDEAKMLRKDFQETVADAILMGIKEYLGL